MSSLVLFFDIGGVIIHADLESYAQHGAPIFQCTPDALREAVQPRVPALEKGDLNNDGFWKEVGESLWQKGLGRPAEPRRTQGFWRRLLIDSLRVDKEMLDLVAQLKRNGRTVAALSNTIPEHAEHLNAVGVYKAFSPCLLSCLVGARKPDKIIYQMAAQKAGVAAKHCLLIDDSPANCAGAKAAGWQSHHFTSRDDLVRELARRKAL